MLSIVVLISGGGSNLRALLEASEDAEFPARVVAVGADRHVLRGILPVVIAPLVRATLLMEILGGPSALVKPT